MRWISVKERLPKIPKGKHGIRVLVATFDPIYAEINGNGYDVYEVSYASTKNSMHFGPNAPEFDFQIIYYGVNNEYHFGPTGDLVTHWMYLPKPPKD